MSWSDYISGYTKVDERPKLTIMNWDCPVLLNRTTPYAKIENLRYNESKHTICSKDLDGNILLQTKTTTVISIKTSLGLECDIRETII